MSARTCLIVILAAGLGTRMRSKTPKVLHPVGGRPMLAHVIATAHQAGADRLAVVCGPDMPQVADLVGAAGMPATLHVQHERKGTGHAVLAARAALERAADDVLVLFGDTPLITPGSIMRVREALAGGADLAVLGFEAADPTGYGRLLVKGGRLVAIREEKDASDSERLVTLCNSGVMGFSGSLLPELLDAIGNRNAQGEYYLTDAVEIANARGHTVVAETGHADEVLGVNNRAQLAQCEAIFQVRARHAAMLGGATLIAPETVFFSHDTKLGADVLIEPNVVFGPAVIVEDGATIRAFSHVEGAHVKSGAVVGPYARLRPGADVGENVRIGNFVEVKKAVLEAGAKVNHLSYIGDARVGAGANVGAGTITCNYDGFSKAHTDIGAGAFIGSNSALVAPVAVGDGAIVAAGSVIVDDVPADAFAVARGRQAVKPGWAAAFRAARRKKPKD
ncbi:bifunctional UDP-N-acetylglucosamine diphosphorylase/glucosamine-1-phosphate N-acetyltransferase GlmU [Breoghania sp. L-A4]|uniref:bifunctional UDP-N-acetylglucosamine diphosphorylase/glucosamine-1-phosphate N-acetyltransferase GlmU n=1 Tax=Breoghania sp. L-A4 TaxID=2304600 RepID=UPI000E35E79F|nr:bifunctional UDP-N-acetylglucosamine diphosphorylase/glucosamine-1-phosphate N-acetyltransferase GlmU [Breoghania sp. L-A4]AXS40492.1 bifunctional UDP-N-acetylglucosamine diphosphorylase/glucosamine-1-phosphate N-acetyltransferase GlmU [Breoghania sp. L-A4]